MNISGYKIGFAGASARGEAARWAGVSASVGREIARRRLRLGKQAILLNRNADDDLADLRNNIQIPYDPANLAQLQLDLAEAIHQLTNRPTP